MKQEYDCKREIRHMRFYHRILNVEETRFDSSMEEISFLTGKQAGNGFRDIEYV